MARRLITVNDILAGHVSLDVACLPSLPTCGEAPAPQQSLT